jgi:hypothetical protein
MPIIYAVIYSTAFNKLNNIIIYRLNKVIKQIVFIFLIIKSNNIS